MPAKTVTMTHPKTEATIQAPATGVEIHKRAGWKVASKTAAAEADVARADKAPGPVPGGDSSKSSPTTK